MFASVYVRINATKLFPDTRNFSSPTPRPPRLGNNANREGARRGEVALAMGHESHWPYPNQNLREILEDRRGGRKTDRRGVEEMEG